MVRYWIAATLPCAALLLGGASSTTLCFASEQVPKLADNETLTSVQEVRILILDEAGRAIPVRLEGVVTYYDPSRQFGFIQDESGGVHFVGQRSAGSRSRFEWPTFFAGDRIELRGRSARGNFSPFVAISADSEGAIRVLETAALPTPIVLPVDRLLNPGNHNLFCEVSAILTEVRTSGTRTILTLNSGGVRYQGFIPLAGKDEVSSGQWTFTDVRIRAVCGALFDKQGRMIGLELFIPSVDAIEPLGEGTGGLFDQEPTSVPDLLRFRDRSPERVLVEGVVLLQQPGKGLYLRSEDRGLWVETNVERSFAPGDTVKAVGRPTPGELRPYLSDAIVQFRRHGEAPAPRQLDPSQALSPEADSNLATVAAQLLDLVDLPNARVMLLQADNTTFTARCPKGPESTTPWPAPANGSWLELTGVCTVQPGGTWQPASRESPNRLTRTPATFTLLLRDSSEMSVLHVPSWWTFERLGVLAGGISLVAALAFVWVGFLRYRLRQQTLLIKQTIERESVQQERARIARDLHDTLQQNLTGILHQLHCATRRLPESAGRARESLSLGKGMIQHSLEELRCVIWNLRSEAFRKPDLNTALLEAVAPFVGRETPRVRFHGSSMSLPLPSVTQHYLVNIVNEAIRNAIKHADADWIDVRVEASEEQVAITVADDGAGFDEQTVEPTRGHYGLIGMKERAARIRGDLRIVSRPDQGTRVVITLPLENVV